MGGEGEGGGGPGLAAGDAGVEEMCGGGLREGEVAEGFLEIGAVEVDGWAEERGHGRDGGGVGDCEEVEVQDETDE